MTDTLIQTIAKALWIGESYFKDIPDNVVTPRHYLDTAKATLTALQDAGYAIVPREPTEAMLEAYKSGPFPSTDDDDFDTAMARDTWAAMIAAITTGERNG